MRKFVLSAILAIGCVSSGLTADTIPRKRIEPDGYEYFFKNAARYIGIYSGPYFKMISVAGKSAVISGGGGGFYFFHRVFAIYELFGMWVPEPLDESTDFQFSQSGGIIGVELFPRKKIHATVHSFFGTSTLDFFDKNGVKDTGSLTAILLEPALDAEFNITQNFRGTLGIGYRLNFGKREYRGYMASDMNGYSLNIGFKFGGF